MYLLILSIAMLAIAPVIYMFTVSRGKIFCTIMDWVTILAVGGLVFFHLVPECYEQGGAPILLSLLVGLVIPSAMERFWIHKATTIHKASILIAIIGLSFHGMLDGIALVLPEATHHHHHHHHHHALEVPFMSSLSFAVLIHQMPVGFLIWSLFYKRYGWLYPTILLSCSALATIAGYMLGSQLIGLEDSFVFWHFQAFICGSLLHIIFDRHNHKFKH